MQLDVTSQAHASLLTELTNTNGLVSISDVRKLSTHSEDDDSGWWSDSGMEAEEDDTLTMARSVRPSEGHMRRGSSAGNWLRRRSASPTESTEIKSLRKENLQLREEIERLEGVLDECSMVLVGMEGMKAGK
jgi:hypothetical protein